MPNPSPTNIEHSTSAPRPLKLWIPATLLVLFWICVIGGHQLDLAMFPRFISRMLSYLVLLIGSLGWWFASRQFSLKVRFLVVGVLTACWLLGSAVSDPTMNPLTTLFAGLPFVLMFGIAWLWISRGRSPRTQIVGLTAVGIGVAGVLALLRWDGLDGRQQAMYSFRWTPTAEEAFLTTRQAQGGEIAPLPEVELAVQPGDWPGFRGEGNGVVQRGTLEDWPASGPEVEWRRRVGPGWSSVTIVGGRLFTQEQRGDAEAVVCYDAATGDELWAHQDAGRFEEGLSGVGPRGTPAFCQNHIYTLGARGRLNCLSAATGEVVWSHDLVSGMGATVPQWGMSSSPLILDNLVIVFVGGSDGRGLVAFDAQTGQQVWAAPAGTMSYSTPHLVTVQGVRQVVMHDNQNLFAVDPADGKLLWQIAHPDATTAPMLQPHLIDETDLVVGWGQGIARLHLERNDDGWQVTERWASNRLKPGFNDFVIHKGFIYGLDDGIFCCVNASSGQRLWKKGRYGFGQILLLPETDQIVVLTDLGDVVLVAAQSSGLKETGRFSAIEGKCWNHPVLAGGRLFVRNGEEMAAYLVGARSER